MSLKTKVTTIFVAFYGLSVHSIVKRSYISVTVEMKKM